MPRGPKVVESFVNEGGPHHNWTKEKKRKIAKTIKKKNAAIKTKKSLLLTKEEDIWRPEGDLL